MSLRNEISLDVDRYINRYGTVSMVDSIIREYSGFTLEELREKNRKRPRVMVRKLWTYLLHEHTDRTNVWIGKHIGNADHSTSYHHLKDVDFMVKNPDRLGSITEKNIVNVINQVENIKNKYYEEIRFFRRATTSVDFANLREKSGSARRIRITNSIVEEYGSKAGWTRNRNRRVREYFINVVRKNHRNRERDKIKDTCVEV